MNNVINVDYMTKTYQTFLQGYKAQTETADTGMDDNFEAEIAHKIDESISQAATVGAGTSVSKAKGVKVVSTEDMTLEQYKQYIHDKISRIPLHPSQRLNSISVHISDEGFEAMQKDSEYEKWVLESLEYNFGFHDPWANLCGGSYHVHYFGATKDEYLGQSWFKGYQNGRGETLFNEKAEDSFWERRVRHKKLMEVQYKRQQERMWQMRKMQNRMYETEMYNRSLLERSRIQGENIWRPGRHLEQFSTSYQTSMLLDLLMMGGGFFG